MCVCVRACVRMCVRAYVRACMYLIIQYFPCPSERWLKLNNYTILFCSRNLFYVVSEHVKIIFLLFFFFFLLGACQIFLLRIPKIPKELLRNRCLQPFTAIMSRSCFLPMITVFLLFFCLFL